MDRIQDQFKRTYEGDAWYGSGLLEILKGVTEETAFQIPESMDRNIASPLLHMVTWMEFVSRSVKGENVKISNEEDWPKISTTNKNNWELIRKQYQECHEKIMECFSIFPEEKLQEIVTGKQFSYYFLFHGVVQHNVYHTAQIALLKRMLK